MMYRSRFFRPLAFVAALGLSAIGCGGNGGGGSSSFSNPHDMLFSEIKDDEPGLLEGDFPILYGFFSNNTNNATGYVEMATINSALAPYERVSGFKIVGDKLYLRVEVADPAKAGGINDNGGPKTPDYVGLVDNRNRKGINDFVGMGDYASGQITPQHAFEHAGFYFNTVALPTKLDPANPSPRISRVFDPDNPANTDVQRVNYGTTSSPVQVSLPPGVANVNLFIEGSKKDSVIVFDPTPADKKILEDLQKHPGYDPSQLKAVILARPTRYAVDRELFLND